MAYACHVICYLGYIIHELRLISPEQISNMRIQEPEQLSDKRWISPVYYVISNC